MTVESVLAHGLKTSVFGSQWNVEYAENLSLLDPDRIKSDLLANRPAAGAAHRFFFATDNQKLYYDTGAAWIEQFATPAAHTHTEGDIANLAADLAGKEPANANIQAHIASAANPHTVTKAQVGLGNVDNTSDAAKPVSAAVQTALNLKANDNAVAHAAGNESIGGVKTFADMMKFSRGVQVASAATLNISNEDGIYFNITGTAGITSISPRGATGTGAAKGILPLVMLKFDGALNITHGSSLILPGGANITTYAGMVLTFVEESAAVWRCIGGISLPRMGVTDGTGAAAGVVGEVITASLSYASRVAMTTDTAKTIATLTLTAGAWDLSGALHYGTSGSTSQFLACISSTTNAITDTSTYGLPSATGEYRAQLDLVASAAYPQYTIPIPSYRLNLGAGATLYLVGYTSFTTGAVNAHGFLQAARVR